MNDPRIDRQERGREKGIQEPEVLPDQIRSRMSQSPTRDFTPPSEARTDPNRGTGEMGTENLDPSAPLAPPA
jgi:hypothetical protein